MYGVIVHGSTRTVDKRPVAVVHTLRHGKRHVLRRECAGGHLERNLDRAAADIGHDLIEPEARHGAVFDGFADEAARSRRRVGLEDRKRWCVESDALGTRNVRSGNSRFDGSTMGKYSTSARASDSTAGATLHVGS